MQSSIIQTRFSALNIPKGLENYVSRVHGLSDIDSQSIDYEKNRLIDFINHFHGKVVIFFLFKTPVTDEKKFFLSINDFNEWALRYIESNLKYKCIIFKIPMVIGYLGIENAEPSEFFSAPSASVDILKNSYFEIIEINDLYDAINSRLSLDKKFSTININSQNILTAEQVVSACFANSQSEQPECLILNDNLDLDSEININCTKSNQNYLKEKYKGSENGLGAKKLLSIVVPTYNEENGIEQFYCRLKSVLNKLSTRFEHEIIFINDCSKDSTLEKLLLLQSLDSNIQIISFARNFGNQIAIAAGIDFLQGDLAVIIDDDLQDPPEVIFSFIAEWERGFKVVYGQRPIREGESIIFKAIARLYYKCLNLIGDIKIPLDTGDFRLIDRQVIDVLKKMCESNKYYRGMIAWVGFSQKAIIYRRDVRYAGSSTFSLKKYINFAFEGLTSFSDKPLHFSSVFGVIVTFISFILALGLVINKVFNPESSIRGWTSLFALVSFFGGIQLITIGILGIYIGKIFRESKGRPLYVVSEVYKK
jgi:dolichol-phosphate mannosyltransferase